MMKRVGRIAALFALCFIFCRSPLCAIAGEEGGTGINESVPLWDFWLTVNASDEGEVLGAGFYHFNNSNPWPEGGLTIEARPYEGFRFGGWFDDYGALISMENPYTFLYGSASINAGFLRTPLYGHPEMTSK